MIKTYTETAHDIQLHVSTWYNERQSDPLKGQFSHTFRILVINDRAEQIRFLLRQWSIQETGQAPRVYEGAGIQGRLPLLEPGETMHYEITVPFQASNLKLTGRYLFQSVNDNRMFEVVTPSFFISAHIFN